MIKTIELYMKICLKSFLTVKLLFVTQNTLIVALTYTLLLFKSEFPHFLQGLHFFFYWFYWIFEKIGELVFAFVYVLFLQLVLSFYYFQF